jgi:hypothetical protein
LLLACWKTYILNTKWCHMTLTPQPKSSFLQEESCSHNREHRRHQHHGKKEHKRKKRRRENLHGGFLKGK